MPLKLPKLPDTRAVHLTVTMIKYTVFVIALAAVGSFVPRFLRSKIRIPLEGNPYMKAVLGQRTIFDLERDARLVENDVRKAARPSQVLRRGDVVLLGKDRRRNDILARVIALPGDLVSMGRTGKVMVNGRSELENYARSYASPEGITTRGVILHHVGQLLVPRGYVFCLTDRRGDSANRTLGLMSLRKIRGKLILGPQDRGEKG